MSVRPIAIPLLFAWLAADPATEPPQVLPWLHHFTATTETAKASSEVVTRMGQWRDPDPTCSASAYGGFALSADVAAEPGTETVLASFTQGVLVLDARDRLIASAMPLPCQGSADDLVAMAAGDARIGEPVIALAVTTGGHREATTWLVLFRVADGVVAPIFAAPVEEHGEATRVGEVTLVSGGLEYRAPSGLRTFWLYDPEQHRYLQLAPAMPGV